MSTAYSFKINPFSKAESPLNLNVSKKHELSTSRAIALSAAAHLIVALVIFQQINLTPTSPNSFHSPITINLMAESRKLLVPAEPSVQKVSPKAQANPVITTHSTSTFSSPEKQQISHKEAAQKDMQETEIKAEQTSVISASEATKKGEEKAELSPVYVAPKFGADYLHNPAPEYPNMARRKGEQGKVLLKVLVSAQGNAEKVLLEKGSGYELLDKSAIDVVKTWKFIPASSNNQPVSGVVIVPIRFSLDS